MGHTNTITWTAGNGSKIAISIAESDGRAVASASVDGVRELERSPTMLKAPLQIGDAVVVATIGKIGLTQERLDAVMAMMSAAQADIDARPDVQMRKLIAQRRRLAEQIGDILDAAHEAHVRFIERASAHGFAHRDGRDFDAEEKAARAALAAFDTAHPDVVAAVAADKAAAAASFLAAD